MPSEQVRVHMEARGLTGDRGSHPRMRALGNIWWIFLFYIQDESGLLVLDATDAGLDVRGVEKWSDSQKEFTSHYFSQHVGTPRFLR